jgi:glutaminyl-peptide cyclotransferase
VLVAQLALAGVVILVATQDFFGLAADEEKPRPAVAARADAFDADRAFREIERQVALGPRPAGSEASRTLSERLRRAMPAGRFEAVPGGLRNVVGTIPGRGKAIVVGAHYDTEATVPDFVGANDGAAGTAAVVELARLLARDRDARPRSGRPVKFVLFDGEEEPVDGTIESGGLRGSRAYVRAHGQGTEEMVLLDYIAHKGARFRREQESDALLWARLRRAAGEAGVGPLFPPGVQNVAIIDDHTPFSRAGIPAVDVIDFSYRHRDTARDTPDKLSRGVLDGVGEATAQLLRNS